MIKGYLHSRDSWILKELMFFIILNIAQLYICVRFMIPGIQFLIPAISIQVSIALSHFGKSFTLYAINNGYLFVCDTYISDKNDITKVERLISITTTPKRYYIITKCDAIGKVYNIFMIVISIILFVISLKTFF